MASTTVTIRPVTEADWREVRVLRLEMLRDTPIAFGETLATAENHPEAEWRLRGRRGTDEGSASFAAIDESTGSWVGTMGGYLPKTGFPLLVGVYVAPSHRGRAAGVTDALLDEVEAWAKGHASAMALHVHEDNARAIRYYAGRGFTETGRKLPYELAPHGFENEMIKAL
ncbi:GNAT family N-acetyltransferase [Frondihabitans sp. Leaf304]|uniref:GNAT family N-acetyltransferase n=1 Tax=Frondihabitans sp. Leaf304 TaxID=1736329 RepID=UPI0006F1E575|nr:N-acetyltransferase [Frondihabitans sp. Leaf304]KQQ28604.1 acetyltransferase [Frondihabitans sp. Leaf304]